MLRLMSSLRLNLHRMIHKVPIQGSLHTAKIVTLIVMGVSVVVLLLNTLDPIGDFPLNASPETIEKYFHRYVRRIGVKCDNIRRFGKVGDGGWNVCLDPAYTLRNGSCLVYSFGINYDFSFDDDIAQQGCEVHSFDPSMPVDDHRRSDQVWFHHLGTSGQDWDYQPSEHRLSWAKRNITTTWTLRTMRKIRAMLGHKESVIDVLKMDIGGSEWPTIMTILKQGDFPKIKQLVFEIHGTKNPNPDKYYWMYLHLEVLASKGFKQFFFHENPACAYITTLTNSSTSNCLELHYINTNYM